MSLRFAFSTERRHLFVVIGCALAFACGRASEPSSTNDGGVEASETTKQELGVVRWSTETDPASIEGYDESGEVVVLLQHVVQSDEKGTQHAFRLREHEHEGVTQFSVGRTAAGVTSFDVLRDEVNDEAFVDHVFERMNEDLMAGQTSLSTNHIGAALRPNDLVDPTIPSIILKCDSAALMNGAATCMSHKSKSSQSGESSAWALACNDYVAKHPGTSRDDIACKKTGEVACTCQPADDGWVRVSKTRVCHLVYAIGQTFPAPNCNDPSKECLKQLPECESNVEWCRGAHSPDNCLDD